MASVFILNPVAGGSKFMTMTRAKRICARNRAVWVDFGKTIRILSAREMIVTATGRTTKRPVLFKTLWPASYRTTAPVVRDSSIDLWPVLPNYGQKQINTLVEPGTAAKSAMQVDT